MKNKRMLFTALSASLLLAACGSGTSEEDTTSSQVESSEETENTGTDETEATESTEEESTDTDSDSSDGTASDETEGDEATDTSGDAPTLEGATETESDEQNYKLDVLPEYELTSEEPGRDMLFVKDNPEMFMHIETMQTAETDYEFVVENMNTSLAASSDDATPVELKEESQLPKSSDIQNVQAFRVTTANGPVTGMIFERGDMTVKVTMYDDSEESYYEDFLNMAETIQSK